MSDWNLGAQFSGYGYREESICLFEKIRKHGIAATACACMGLREDPFKKGNLIPVESALALERGEPLPPCPDIFESRLYFYQYPKPVLQHCFSPTKHFLSRTYADKFLLRFSLTPLKNWSYYPDGALAPDEGCYFVLPGVAAGKMVVAPNAIEILCADLRWRSFFWYTRLRGTFYRPSFRVTLCCPRSVFCIPQERAAITAMAAK